MHLIKAEKRGCSSLEYPAVRWAAYVHDLRRDFGIVIETIRERHAGPFPGNHARYVLHSEVEAFEEGDQQEAA